jgi:hypothetical protein
MPIQVIPAGKNFGSEFGKALGGGFSSGVSSALESAREMKKIGYQAELKKKEMAEQLKGNTQIIRHIEKERGLEEGSLDPYVNDPKMAETVSRPPKKTQSSQPIDPAQLKSIQEVRDNPEYEKANPLKKYQMLLDNNVSRENAQSEADIAAKSETVATGKFDKAYKANENFINETTSKHSAFETETKPRLMQMQHIPSEEIISAPAAQFLEFMGIPLGAIDSPGSELYDKLSHDLLKGLPETFGNKILKVEVDNFLKTIPTLMNSVEGRRMIATNMLKLGEMKEVYYNEMRKQQQDYLEKGDFPIDFQQKVFDQVKPQIDKLNNEFMKLSEIKHIPPGEIPFFDPNGDIVFVPQEHAEWATNQGGKRIW